MSDLFGNLNGIAAGIYQMVLQKFADNPIPVPATDATRVVYNPTGANAVPRTVAAKFDDRGISLADYASLRDAVIALGPNGGVINVPVGRFPAGVWRPNDYMALNNVVLRGEQRPWYSSSCDRLVGGSIIEGRFIVWAHNFQHHDIGYDFGREVCDRLYPGFDTHTNNHPDGGGWDGFVIAQPDQAAPQALRTGYVAQNVITLLRDPLSYGHSILQEGIDGGVIDNVIGVGGIHGHVVKSKNIDAGFIAGYGASENHIIFKSDTYAAGGSISARSMDTGFAPPGTAPWWGVVAANNALTINPATADMGSITIGRLRVAGAHTLLRLIGNTPGRILDGFVVGQLDMQGQGVVNPAAMSIAGVSYTRLRFGDVFIVNVADGIGIDNQNGYGIDPVRMESLTLENVSLRAVNLMGYAKLIVGSIRGVGIATMYTIADTARIHVGYEQSIDAATKFAGAGAPAINDNWEQVPGAEAFGVMLAGYGVEVKGLLRPLAGANSNAVKLPQYLRSAEFSTQIAMGRTTGGVDAAVSIAQGGSYGFLAVNGGAGLGSATGTLSLGGVKWLNS